MVVCRWLDVGMMSVGCRLDVGLLLDYRRTSIGLPPAADPCVIAATEDSCLSGGNRYSTLPGKMAGPVRRIERSGGVVVSSGREVVVLRLSGSGR